jgi:glutaconyl-CoA decarboxylase
MAFDAASAEATGAFGNATLYMERYFENARHIEVQILADHFDNIIHLGERDCSLQRRYQKVIEEAPAYSISDEIRMGIHNAAIAIARKIAYKNAGTIEFILDEDEDRFYFLEVNPRIQVEHPVTEMVTGIDIVKEQIRIAGHHPLNISQSSVEFNGHAIECRINAESPEDGFRPSVGVIEKWVSPNGRDIRIDTHCYEGYNVSPYYDSLLSKTIAWGVDRSSAIERMKYALENFTITGVRTTLPFVRFVLNREEYVKGKTNTRWLENIIPRYVEDVESSRRHRVKLPACFEGMRCFGKQLTPSFVKQTRRNAEMIRQVETEIDKAAEEVKKAGLPQEILNEKRGEWTIYQRLEYLIDPDTWCPLHTLFNPMDEESGTTGVVGGLGRIDGKWVVVIGFDNKILAGAWLPGQAENILRITDISKRLHLPLVWLVNCSGVKLTEQQKVYANRRGSGTTFFRHAELEKVGIPILAAIWGTNQAGGGYQGISPTILLAHKDCNIAVGGVGIVSGMSPKGCFDKEFAEMTIEATKKFSGTPPGRVDIHYDETGFFREVYGTEKELLDALKRYVEYLPAYNPNFFRLAEPREPRFPVTDLYHIIPFNQKISYSFDEVLARLVDDSAHMEYKPDYGPEVYTGLVRINGYLIGIVGNRTGFLPEDYPEYAPYRGIGGKLYRQGLIKMNEFVTACGRDRVPIIWFQDTTGIDVGDHAEKAELLALGQSLIHSIEQSDLPMICIVLRKGTAAAHYIMGGPQANNNNAFTLGIATTEIYVMHGETAAVATYARRLVKVKDQDGELDPIIEAMNKLSRKYYDQSRPGYCAKLGLVDEVVKLKDLRRYLMAFATTVYQNPKSFCMFHHMILPRVINR